MVGNGIGGGHNLIQRQPLHRFQILGRGHGHAGEGGGGIVALDGTGLEGNEDDDADEQVGLLGELFLQENPGQQQRNYTDRGQNGCGNGIGYATYYDTELGSSESAAAWGVLRVDIYNKTAIKMNTPNNLYLNQYQYAKVVDGKVYMALCPVGGEGNVYIFDSAVASADGFTVGATLKTGAGASYIGIF